MCVYLRPLPPVLAPVLLLPAKMSAVAVAVDVDVDADTAHPSSFVFPAINLEITRCRNESSASPSADNVVPAAQIDEGEKD